MATTFDYDKQAWIVDGRYVKCGHQQDCDCYGKAHEGEKADKRDNGTCEGVVR